MRFELYSAFLADGVTVALQEVERAGEIAHVLAPTGWTSARVEAWLDWSEGLPTDFPPVDLPEVIVRPANPLLAGGPDGHARRLTAWGWALISSMRRATPTPSADRCSDYSPRDRRPWPLIRYWRSRPSPYQRSGQGEFRATAVRRFKGLRCGSLDRIARPGRRLQRHRPLRRRRLRRPGGQPGAGPCGPGSARRRRRLGGDRRRHRPGRRGRIGEPGDEA